MVNTIWFRFDKISLCVTSFETFSSLNSQNVFDQTWRVYAEWDKGFLNVLKHEKYIQDVMKVLKCFKTWKYAECDEGFLNVL